MNPIDSAMRLGASQPWAALHLLILLVTLFPAPQALAQEGLARGQELTPIGHARISAVYDLDAQPPYAYALERENLRVLDVRDPGQVKEVANLEFEGARLRSVIHGSGLYMSGWGEPLAVVDISAPLQPRWVGEHPEVRETDRMLVVADRLYVVGHGGTPYDHKYTLHVLALTETAAIPRQVATLSVEHDTTLRLAGFAHDDGRLFILLQQTALARSELVVVDIDNPSQPRLKRRIALPGGLVYRGVAVRGNICYTITHDPTGLTILDLSGLDEAALLGSVTDDRLWAGGGMILRGNVLYANFKRSAILATFDVSDPQHPRLVHAFVPEGWNAAGLGFSIAEDRLYLSGDMGPSAIFDVSSPPEPRYLGRWEYQGGWAKHVALHERVAVVLNWGAGVLIYDVAEPSSPTPLGVYRSAGHPLDHLASDGDLILLSHGPQPSELVDISDPSAPTLAQKFDVPEAVAAGALTSTHAIQAYARGGLGIVGLSDPNQSLSHVALDGPATDIALHEDLAVVAHRDGGVSVIDIGIPESPMRLGRTAGFESDDERDLEMVTRVVLSTDGTRAFTVRGEVESNSTLILTLHDLRRRSAPRALGQLEVRLGGRPASYDFPILVDGNELLVGAGSDLVRIDISDPHRPTVSSRRHLKMSMAAEGFARQDKYLFVAASEDGMQVFELPNR